MVVPVVGHHWPIVDVAPVKQRQVRGDRRQQIGGHDVDGVAYDGGMRSSDAAAYVSGTTWTGS